MPPRLDRRDTVWIVVLAAAFLAGLAASWERWANPLIDCGREMQMPLRLAAGEILYSDVRHLYGPLSPYLHAVLYRLAGPSLAVLYADGILCAVIALALVHGIARRIMPPFAAGTATLSVMWLCVFKPAGNYVAPYSYNALHGAVLGLVATTLSLRLVQRSDGGTARRSLVLPAAIGVTAGLAVLAKTEMGAAAIVTGLVAALLDAPGERRDGAAAGWRDRLSRAGVVVASAMLVAGGGFAWMVSRAGWNAVAGDSFLLLYNVPPALARYNAWISGLDHPVRSIGRIAIAAAKMACLAAIALAATELVPGRGRAAAAAPGRSARGVAAPLPMLLLAGGLLLVMSLVTGFDWDKGPYLAMPLLLAWILVVQVRRLRRGDEAAGDDADPRVLIVCATYALVSLGRMALHVRSGGAYGSYLLPVSVVLFTYAWAVPFGAWGQRRLGRRRAADLVVWLLLLDAIVTAGLLAHRYRARYTVPVVTSRGTLVAEPAIGRAWNEAIAFIEARTHPGDPVVVVPEGTSLLFLTGRRNPLREEITTPGYLDGPAEGAAIARLEATGTRLVLVANRATPEFGPRAFGRDYATGFMHFVEAHFVVCGQFGPGRDPALVVGDRPFFVRAYCR